MKRTEEEQRIIDHIDAAAEGIVNLGNGLAANGQELASALHTLQMFVMMSVLHRASPEEWSNWYDPIETSDDAPVQ